MESKATNTPTDQKTELAELKRSNAMAIHLYKACESDMEVLMTLYNEVSDLYSKLYEQHKTKISETVEQLKKAREERLKISTSKSG